MFPDLSLFDEVIVLTPAHHKYEVDWPEIVFDNEVVERRAEHVTLPHFHAKFCLSSKLFHSLSVLFDI